MVPIIKVTNEVLEGLNKLKIPYDIQNEKRNLDNFIYVPSLKIHVAKQRTHLGATWFDAHKELQKEGLCMPTIPEFVEFLKYLKSLNNKEFQEIYNDITQVRSPWRAEWLDADFKMKDKDLYINFNHVLDSNGNLVPKNSSILDKETLMKDKLPGISLDNYLESSHTKQGLPNKKVKSGSLYYQYPRSDNNSVARFDALSGRAPLSCGRDPSNWASGLGVRAVRHE